MITRESTTFLNCASGAVTNISTVKLTSGFGHVLNTPRASETALMSFYQQEFVLKWYSRQNLFWLNGNTQGHSSNDLTECAKYSLWNHCNHHHHHPVQLNLATHMCQAHQQAVNLATQRCDPHLMLCKLFRSDGDDEPNKFISSWQQRTGTLQPWAFVSSNYSSA